ncbi:unnamed protein product [Mycena citricolor]|uniref:ribonuclease H n=1 Tax=Mycena citricolor TaxID=2018698 RepID=A0AAD2JYK1_9AGAR|nr:unnamed protein product [Mycena citricolor]
MFFDQDEVFDVFSLEEAPIPPPFGSKLASLIKALGAARTFVPVNERSGNLIPTDFIRPLRPVSEVFEYRNGNRTVAKETIIVQVDGACSGNGRPEARAGVGIYFGPGSVENVSRRIDGRQTSNHAEVRAALEAMKKLTEMFDNDRLLLVRRMVLLVDSSHVFRAMTEWIFSWRENGWRTSGGAEVKNKACFQELDRIVTAYESHGFAVQFWLVRREFNKEADLLAKNSYL